LEKLGESKGEIWKSLEKAWKKLGGASPVSRETNHEH
jgi:hypothetical protein